MRLTDKDREIVRELASEARLSIKDLASRVGLSAPSAAERLRRLQDLEVIRAFTIVVDPAALGYPLEAIVRIRPLPGRLIEVQQLLIDTPEISSCDKVTGDDCFVARLHLRSIADLDEVLEKIAAKAETSTSLVKSSPVKGRLPPL